MSLKKVLYNKYGIIIKESESNYFNYLIKKSKNKYEYSNALKEFIENCSIRYFKKEKIKNISKDLIREEIGRDSHTPDAKGDAGNITIGQILQDEHDIYVEETIDSANGKNAIYLEDEEKNNKYIEMDIDYMPIFNNAIRTKNINK